MSKRRQTWRSISSIWLKYIFPKASPAAKEVLLPEQLGTSFSAETCLQESSAPCHQEEYNVAVYSSVTATSIGNVTNSQQTCFSSLPLSLSPPRSRSPCPSLCLSAHKKQRRLHIRVFSQPPTVLVSGLSSRPNDH